MATILKKEPSRYTILVVDDEELMRNMIVTFLSSLGHSCFTAADGVDALDKMKGNKIDAVITDMEPHGQCPWSLGQRHVGRHSGHTMAHSSTAKGRGLLLPE